jgi:hypothetical protein
MIASQKTGARRTRNRFAGVPTQYQAADAQKREEPKKKLFRSFILIAIASDASPPRIIEKRD